MDTVSSKPNAVSSNVILATVGNSVQRRHFWQRDVMLQIAASSFSRVHGVLISRRNLPGFFPFLALPPPSLFLSRGGLARANKTLIVTRREGGRERGRVVCN